jgi:methionyl-tRNA formyltransferase
MKKFGFFTLGEKAYKALKAFISDIGVEYIGFVLIAVDKKLSADFSEEIESLCIQYGIPYSYRHETKKRAVTELDFAVGWRWMLPKENLVVLHDSLLPMYRGFSPLVNMLINGEENFGVTALLASDEYDTGEILYQESIKIEYPVKIADAIAIISELYVKVLIEVASNVIKNKCLVGASQNESKATYSLWRDDEDYFVNWTNSATRIERVINALGEPYAGAKSIVNNKVMHLMEAVTITDVIVEDRESNIGKVIFFSEGCPVVVCGVGLLKVIHLVEKQGGLVKAKINFRSKFKNFGCINDTF